MASRSPSMSSSMERPSHSPKDCSSHSASTTGSTPTAAATAAPVSIARDSDDVTTRVGWPCTRLATARPAATAWARPVALSRGSGPPRPSSRPCAVKSVTPCRTSTTRVGVPRRSNPVRRALVVGLGLAGHVVDLGRAAEGAVDHPAVHRDVRQGVGVLVLGPRDPREAHGAAGPGEARHEVAGLQGQAAHVLVLDLPAARHLLDDELGVHPHVHLRRPGRWRARPPARRSARGTPRRCSTAVPSGSARSASTAPVSASRTRAP